MNSPSSGSADAGFEKPKPDVNNVTLGYGLVLTVAAAIAGWLALGYIESIVSNLIVAILSLYTLGAIATFWLAGLWRDGLTKGECWVLVIWFWKVWKILRTTNMAEAFRNLSLGDDGVATAANGVINNEAEAKETGQWVSAIVGFFAVLFLVISLVTAGVDAIKALALLQVVSAAGYYWAMGFYRCKPSFGMALEIVGWQFDLFRDLWKKVQAVRMAWKNRTAPTA